MPVAFHVLCAAQRASEELNPWTSLFCLQLAPSDEEDAALSSDVALRHCMQQRKVTGNCTPLSIGL